MMKTSFSLKYKPNKDINNIDLKAKKGHYYNQNLQKFLENNNIKEEKNDNINCELQKLVK